MKTTVKDSVEKICRAAKTAAAEIARADGSRKNAALAGMAAGLRSRAEWLKKENRRDMDAGKAKGLSPAMLDRLLLTDARIRQMADGIEEVIALPDPVGEILRMRRRPNGLMVGRMRIPLGVIGIIYESRPNVTADAAALCVKSGNAVVLRGGSEAIHSNLAICLIIRNVLPDLSLPEAAIQIVPVTDREAVYELLQLEEMIDVIIPRGGEELIRAVVRDSKIPVIKHYKGVCHVFVDRDADLPMAEAITVNAKCQRPATCNAAETLLVDWPIATEFLPRIAARPWDCTVQLRCDTPARAILGMKTTPPPGKLVPVADEDWSREYNDYVINVRVVDGIDEAITHITRHGSSHSDAIVTRNEPVARRFLAEVDSASVYWNASTRFTDGSEFGMGAEIGISTDKIGARGPMGLDELCTYKWIGVGTGQTRQ